MEHMNNLYGSQRRKEDRVDTSNGEEEQPYTDPGDQCWRSGWPDDDWAIPRSITIWQARSMLPESKREEFDEDIASTAAYLLEAAIVRWLMPELSPMAQENEVRYAAEFVGGTVIKSPKLPSEEELSGGVVVVSWEEARILFDEQDYTGLVWVHTPDPDGCGEDTDR